jgi:hypothetical protein
MVLLLTGCPTGPTATLPADVDLSEALQLAQEGKAERAVAELARKVKLLSDSGRTDVKAHCAWGRILHLLHRLDFRAVLARSSPEDRSRCEALSRWTGPGGAAILVAGSASHWSQVLKSGADPALMAEGARAIADLLAEKAERPALRRGRIEPEDATSELLYRRFLLENSADLKCYALARQPGGPTLQAGEEAGRGLELLAAELGRLASAPGAKPKAAEIWTERARALERQAQVLRKEPGLFELSPDLRRSVESDPDDLLRLSIEHFNVANRELSRRGDDRVILEAFEGALRHFIAARECLVEPSPIQKRTLDTLPIAADGLRRHSFDK